MERIPGRSSDAGPEPRQRPHPEEERFTCCICGFVGSFEDNEYRCQGAVPDECQNPMCEDCYEAQKCAACGLPTCKEHAGTEARWIRCAGCDADYDEARIGSKCDLCGKEIRRIALCHCCQAGEISEKIEALHTSDDCRCELHSSDSKEPIRNAGNCYVHRPGGEWEQLERALAALRTDFSPGARKDEEKQECSF